MAAELWSTDLSESALRAIVAECWRRGDIDDAATGQRGDDPVLRALEPVGPSGHVLVVGAGGGTTAERLAAATGARIASVDGDLAALSYGDATFSRGWSRASLLMANEPRAALAELARVMQDGAIFVFDEFVRPTGPGAAGARAEADGSKLVPVPLSGPALRRALAEAGLMVVEAEDWTDRLRRTCEALVSASGAQARDTACGRLMAAIDAGEVGRSFLKAIRVYSALHWPYQHDDTIGILEKYDAVADRFCCKLRCRRISDMIDSGLAGWISEWVEAIVLRGGSSLPR
jgi:SAM-dependent methyltransferase